MTYQGWTDDGLSPDYYWDDVACGPYPIGRERRRNARRWRQRVRNWRKVERHANDRFWQARNRPAFDDSALF